MSINWPTNVPYGSRKCACRVCGKFFTTPYAFDKHRAGSFKKNERFCLPTEDMVALGMVENELGYWVSSRLQFLPEIKERR